MQMILYPKLNVLFYGNMNLSFIIPDICGPGQYSVTGYAPCWDCPYHFYQADEGQTSCDRCLGTTVLEQLAATHSNDCTPMCKYRNDPNFRTDRSGQTVQTLIRVFTVCYSTCIFLGNFSAVRPMY